jgi:hypothetical protein
LSSYTVLWSRSDAVYAGKAVLEGGSLVLTGVDRRGHEARERLELGDVVATRIVRGAHERLEGRPVLELVMLPEPSLRVACLGGGGTLLELAERLTSMNKNASVGG